MRVRLQCIKSICQCRGFITEHRHQQCLRLRQRWQPDLVQQTLAKNLLRLLPSLVLTDQRCLSQQPPGYWFKSGKKEVFFNMG